MKLAALFSGGKDSAYAAWLAMREHDVVCLVSIVSENPESYMFHTPNISLVGVQAKAADLPLIVRKTRGEKEKELADLKVALLDAKDKHGVKGVVTGALASVYQASRIQDICSDIGLKVFNPLWQKDQVELLHELVDEGFDVMIAGVFAYPFDESWLGRRIDDAAIKDLVKMKDKFSINPAGEGGEMETFVLDAPFFKKRIVVVDKKTEYKDHAGVMHMDVELEEK